MARRPITEKSPLVLVVDRDADTREMYAEFFAYSGFRVAHAECSDEAREKARSLRPSVIMTEVGICDSESDRDLCEQLKVDEDTRTIPVVVLTAWVLDGYLDRARRAGCEAVLLKPCSPATLVSEFRKLLHRQSVVLSRPGSAA